MGYARKDVEKTKKIAKKNLNVKLRTGLVENYDAVYVERKTRIVFG